MAVLILTFVIVLAVVGAISLLSPDREADGALSNNTPPANPPRGDEDTEPVPTPSFHLDGDEALASGKMFNLTGNDDEPGFYI
ncbi:hypothetical protein [Pseudoxanthomonas mexicana]